MECVVDSKEGARLILAYERVAELLSSAGESGVQREHLLMGFVLHCTKNEETLLQNVLKTRQDLVSFYKNAESAVAHFMELDQSIPEPPTLASEKEQADEEQADEEQADEEQADEEQADKEQADEEQAGEEQADEFIAPPKRAQPHIPTTTNNSAVKISKSPKQMAPTRPR